MSAATPAPPLTVLQITDLHLLPEPGARLLGVDTQASLEAVLAQAFAERRPEAVIASGDVTHHGDAATYARLLELLRSYHTGPVLLLPGNHDESGAMGELLEPAPTVTLGAWTLIGFDSHVDGRPEAAVSAAERQALEAACEQAGVAGQHVLLATHHPPISIGCPWLDKDRIQDGPELLEWLAEHTTVVAMVFGHAHQVIEEQRHGLRLLGTPSTCFQFLPHSESFSIDRAKPGYRWLTLHGDGSLGSEVKRVDDYPLELELPA